MGRKQKRRASEQQGKPVAGEAARRGGAWAEAMLGGLRRHAGKLSLLFVLLATLRIVAVYAVYNHTIDEPAHIACGMEWLTQPTYRLETQHPPLARIVAALGPRLAGARFWGRGSIYNEGAAILYDGRFDLSRYEQLLTAARAGMLVFFGLCCACIYRFARRWFGPEEAALAVLLFTLTPPVLGHAGLATTDMALTACFAAAVVALVSWVERAGWASASLLGVALGAAVLSKFSFLAYFPAFVAWLALLGRMRGQKLKLRWRWFGWVVVLAALVIWAGYKFSFGPGPFHWKMPAPELFSGIEAVRAHNREGHPAYLLGRWSREGWYHYYFVVLGLKTPLPLLILGFSGAWLAWRRKSLPALAILAVPGGVLSVAMMAKINIGVRHVLPVYVALAWLGALALKRWLETRWRWLAAVMTAAVVVGGAMAHPDYLPYMNFLAGPSPERFLADSDLDWGQDMKRLSRRLRELGATQVAFSPLIAAHLERVHGFPRIVPSDPLAPEPGWNAVSITVWKSARFGLEGERQDVTLWPDRFRFTERVGRGVLLYYFPPAWFRSSAGPSARP